VRDGVGVLDLPGFSRFKVAGKGARDWLNSLTVSRLPSAGRLTLAYFADSRGRILTEMSVFAYSDEEFTLITAAPAQWHDFEVLKKALPVDGSITLTDHTADYSCLIVTGPQSRALFEKMETEADLAKGWLTFQEASVAGTQCVLARVSFAGELGWEIHAPQANMPALYAAVLDAGATPFGMYALNSMRIEKGYRAWKGDLSTDYSLLEGGLDRFVKLDKDVDFPGKAALLNEQQQGRKKGFVTLEIEAGERDAPYMAPVWRGDEIVGEITSCAMGYRTGKCIALGMVRADCLDVGTMLQVDVFGERHAATVQNDQPMWDPKNERIRA